MAPKPTFDMPAPQRVGATWVFADGTVLPVIAGGDGPVALKPESTLADVRQHLGDTARKAIELRAIPEKERGDTFVDDLRAAIDDIHFVDAIEKALWAEERGRQAVKETEERARGPRGAFERAEDERITPGNEFVKADGYEEWATGGQRGVFQAEVRTLLTSSTTDPAAGLFRPVGTPFLGNVRQRRPFVRDLLTVSPTGLSSVPYIRELNPLTNETGAQMTSEGSAKAEVTMQFESADAPMRKITAWVPVTSEILADAPTLRGYIDTRLEYMLLIREEQQVLFGTGAAPQITGITETVGTQTQAAVAGDVPATFAEAFGKIENVDGDPDAVVMNPIDFWTAVSTRHATNFDNGFGGNAPAEMSSITWGERVVRTRAMTALSALAGAFRMGATLYQREGVVIKVGEQHSDFFVHNKVAIVAEERIGLAVFRPDWFVEVTLDHTA
jgi:HK97 family phage major capsid protein